MPFQSVFVTPRGNRKIVEKCPGAPKAKMLNILAKRMPFQSVFVTLRGNRGVWRGGAGGEGGDSKPSLPKPTLGTHTPIATFP